jgi:hypothetical protein
MSPIHVKDVAGLLLWAAQSSSEGLLNAVLPDPVRNVPSPEPVSNRPNSGGTPAVPSVRHNQTSQSYSRRAHSIAWGSNSELCFNWSFSRILER